MNERIQIAPPTPEQNKKLANAIVDTMECASRLSAAERKFIVRKMFGYLGPGQKFPEEKETGR